MPGTYPQTWFPVLIQILIAIAVAGAMIGLSAVLGQRVRDPVKSSPYESGMQPIGSARERFIPWGDMCVGNSAGARSRPATGRFTASTEGVRGVCGEHAIAVYGPAMSPIRLGRRRPRGQY